jgi:hypothetical protein
VTIVKNILLIVYKIFESCQRGMCNITDRFKGVENDDDNSCCSGNFGVSTQHENLMLELSITLDCDDFDDSSSSSDEEECSSFHSDEYSSTKDEEDLGDLCCITNYDCKYKENDQDDQDDTNELFDERAFDFDKSIQSIGGVIPIGCDRKKQVHFGSVTIREYSVTVGVSATGSPYNSCPIQLDWPHSTETTSTIQNYSCIRSCLIKEKKRVIHSRGDFGTHISKNCSTISTSFVHRLSPRQRRERIARVRGISLSKVEMMEMDIALGQIHQTLKMCNSILLSSSLVCW